MWSTLPLWLLVVACMEMHSVVSQDSHNGSEPARGLSSISHRLWADFAFCFQRNYSRRFSKKWCHYFRTWWINRLINWQLILERWMAAKPNPSCTICVNILFIQAESWYTLRVEHFKILKSPSVKNRNYLQKIAVGRSRYFARPRAIIVNHASTHI